MFRRLSTRKMYGPAEQAADDLDLLKDYTGKDVPPSSPYYTQVVNNTVLPMARTHIGLAALQHFPVDVVKHASPTPVPISSLRSAQDYLAPQQLAAYVNGAHGADLPIITAMVNGERVIINGTHRAAAYKINHKSTIQAKDAGEWTLSGNTWKGVPRR